MSKKTALYDSHLSLSGQMVEFSHTLLPVRYQSEAEEHKVVREDAGIFDISHMGEFFVSGADAATFLQKILTNNLEHLDFGQAQYTLLLNHEAGIIDDLIVYRLSGEKYLLCVNASNIEKDFSWIKEQSAGFNVEIEDASDKFSLIALQGPKALDILRSITTDELPLRFGHKYIYLNGIDCLMAHTGYTGEEGVEIFVKNDEAKALWDLLLERGRAFNLKPCGLSARDSLRLEAGLLLWGQDMDENTSPIDAGLMFAVDLSKDFIGHEVLVRKKQQGAQKKLMGFILKDRGVARHESPVLDQGQKHIGVVTSGTYLPEKKLAIGFAYVTPETKLGQDVFIDIRGRLAPAVMKKTKFLNNGAHHE